MANTLAPWSMLAGLTVAAASSPALADGPEPLFSDFMGINGHSVLFEPELYNDAATLVRDYHGLDWDIDPNSATGFPNFNRTVPWSVLYDEWADAGYRINTAIQFDNEALEGWGTGATLTNAAKTYGREFARTFGAAVGNGLVSSVQIGNEPGDVPDDKYAQLFKAMAEGIREIDPGIKIVTCNVTVGPSHQYAKSLSLFNTPEMKALVDAYATHSYPFKNTWPTWERAHPEYTAPGFTYRSDIQNIINWRNANAPASQVWLTEFGYDASTQTPDPNGEWAQWKDVTDTQQAQWITRSFLTFANMDLDRAYLYWANDGDTPSLHASSGITRNYVPKPSYWAMKHLKETLDDYRFSEAITESTTLRVYEFVSDEDPTQLIWAIWRPTGSNASSLVTLTGLEGDPLWADRMPLAAGSAPLVNFTELGNGSIRLTVGESPIYLRIALPIPEPATAALLAAPCFLTLLNRRTL